MKGIIVNGVLNNVKFLFSRNIPDSKLYDGKSGTPL